MLLVDLKWKCELDVSCDLARSRCMLAETYRNYLLPFNDLSLMFDVIGLIDFFLFLIKTPVDVNDL